ncbi:uncharacterized protein LOC135387357 [Ornithodoros turicata]|uniref:uncharacterized protein LOC135387357 n=1 Tax=Ornithodoros turicata TaxID=34597 RepID=UPI00313A1CE4
MPMWVQQVADLFWSFLTWLLSNLSGYQQFKEGHETESGMDILEEWSPQNFEEPVDDTPPPSPLLAFPETNVAPPSPTSDKDPHCYPELTCKDSELVEPNLSDTKDPETLQESTTDIKFDAEGTHKAAKQSLQVAVRTAQDRTGGSDTNSLDQVRSHHTEALLDDTAVEPSGTPRSARRSGQVQSWESLTSLQKSHGLVQHCVTGLTRRVATGSGEPA